jgi:hypothetical protein
MRRAVAITAVVLSLVLPSAASAGPAKGAYTCSYWTGYGYGYGGTVRIINATTYNVNKGKRSRYWYNAKRRFINFKTGPYRTFFAKYYPRKTLFEVFDRKTGDSLWTCDK